MSPYYKYDFTSPEPVYALVREELKSYFDAGSLDDLLFPTWTDHCLRKLGRSSYPIVEGIVQLDDFQATLPEDFVAVREAWLCVSATAEIAAPNSVYWVEQEQVNQMEDAYALEHASDVPEQINIVMKKSRTLVASFAKQYLLRPGNIALNATTGLECRNYGAQSADSFDIRGGKIVTNFRHGIIYLVYYSTEMDSCGNQSIPDNFRIKDYIEKYLVYKSWKTLADNAVDEGQQNRYDRKAAEAKVEADEKLILANIEIRKETVYQKADRLKRQNTRLNRFNIK